MPEGQADQARLDELAMKTYLKKFSELCDLRKQAMLSLLTQIKTQEKAK